MVQKNARRKLDISGNDREIVLVGKVKHLKIPAEHFHRRLG